MTPSSQQYGTHDLQCHICENRAAERDGHVKTHAEFSADFNLSQGPRDESADRTNGDDLPDTTFVQRRQSQTITEIWWRDADLPQVPGRPDGRPINQQSRAEQCEKCCGDTKESDIEGAYPEVE